MWAMERKKLNRRIIFMADDSFLDHIDEWRSRHRPIPNFSEAVRELLEMALNAEDD